MFNLRKIRNQLSSGTGDISGRQRTPSPLRTIPITVAQTTEGDEKSPEHKRKPTTQLTDSPPSSSATMPVSSADLCSGFEPQTWKKDRCRKCFRFKDQHTAAVAAANSSSNSAAGGSEKRQANTSSAIPIEIKTYEKPKLSMSDSKSRQANGRDVAAIGDSGNSIVKSPRSSNSNSSDGMDVSATYILKSAASNVVAQEKHQDDLSKRRRTKFVILKAEVSVDGTPAEEVSLETSIVTDSPSNSRPSSRASRPSSRRSLSPPDESYRSAASSAAEYVTASSGYDPLSRTVSWESVASTILDDKSFVTGGSGGAMSERSCTPTESLDETRSFVRSIKAQLEIMENKCAKLEQENAKLRVECSNGGVLLSGSTSGNDEIKTLKEKLVASEALSQDYKDENTVLKCELRDLQQSSASKQNESEKKALKATLTAAEQLCEELMDENENLKRDVQGLQQEISEMHDQYREEEIEEFRELQRDLEQSAKNCRVLQFKLRKAERKCDQTEADRMHLEEKIKELLGNSTGFDPSDTPRVRELESELRIAKEVSVRLHNELETVDEKRCKLEDENFYLREKIREIETREKLIEQSLLKQDQQKKSTSSMTRSMPNAREFNSMAGQNGSEQLLRDLKDTLERETDLKEQLKFAEEDIQAARKKLADLETENEGLVQQLTKLTSGGGHNKGKPPMRRSYSEGHAQIELELAEHEAHVLKSKLDRLEKENEHLLSQNSLLEKEVKKTGGKTNFTPDDFPDTYYKNKIKMLEEEINDWKLKFETMQKTEADQDTARRYGKLVRSHSAASSSSDSSKSELDLQRKLDLVEQEAGVLRLRISDLELENERLCGENKRVSIGRKSSVKSTGSHSSMTDVSSLHNEKDPEKIKVKIDQMQKDIHRFINRISELEREKEALNKEVDRRKKLENIKKESTVGVAVANVSKLNLQTATASELRSRIQELMKENGTLSNNLTTEQKKMVELESQLSDYKEIISQSENEKLITMASKVEVLTNQLKEAQTRYDSTQKKMVGQTGKKYEDVMKEQIERLEKSLEEERNKAKNQQQQSVSLEMSDENSFQELTKSNQLLKFVEEQVDRLCKQIEKVESQHPSPKPSPRVSRSPKTNFQSNTLSPANVTNGDGDGGGLLKDIGEIKKELEGIKTKLSERKKDVKLARNGKISTTKTATISETTLSSEQLLGKCQQQEKLISDLKEQLEVSKQERVSAYHECETATARLLQTEERWNKELEKVKESYENQVKDLKYYLKEAEKMRDEKTMLLHDREALLQEKTKRSAESEVKVQKLESELKVKHKDLQERLETEKKKSKDFEAKYQKLEALYESDRQKLSTEKEKFKTDLLDMKKKYDDTQSDFEKLKSTYEKKEQMWQKEKVELESRVKVLQEEMKEIEKNVSKKAAETASLENKKLMSELAQLRKKMETDFTEWKSERVNLQSSLEQKNKDLEFRLDELERMKKEANLMKSRVLDQKQQLEETRRMRDDAREELSRWQQTWTREKAEIGHKKRQEEKMQQAEQHALQLKYESRMKIMEDSHKRVQSELTQIRRERDQIREALAVADKRLAAMREKHESGERVVRQDITEIEKKKELFESLKSELDKETSERKVLQKNYDIDKRLWSVEREQFMNKIQDLENGTATMYSIRARANAGKMPPSTSKNDSEKLLTEAMEVGVQLRKQVDEMKQSRDEETKTLRQQLEKVRQDSHKEKHELQRKIKDLQDNLKILDIDRRNMMNTKGENLEEKNVLQIEKDALMDKLHDAEVHQLANKYKLDKVAEQLNDLQCKIQSGGDGTTQKTEFNELIKKAMDQLLAVREDMGKTRELGKNLDSLDYGDDNSSVSSKRSVSSKKVADLESIERETGESLLGKEKFDALKGRSPRSTRKDHLTTGKSESQDSYNMIRSTSTDTAFEARIAELRLRSASPVPRKVTNYPEAPPNMIINVKNAVEYDSDGRRHWTRRSQIKRSTSFDPTPVSASSDVSDNEESKSTRSHIRDPSSDCEDNRRSMNTSIDTDTDISSTGSQSPRSRRKIIDIFATLRKRKSKDRRKLFGKKANSIETSDVGHTIGAIAVQIFPPAVDPSTLPETMQTPVKVDEPPKLAKSGSGSSLFAKFRRNRSSSRGGLPRQSASVDTGSDAPSGRSTPSVFGSKTNSQDNVLPSKEIQLSSSHQYQPPQIASRHISTTTTTATSSSSFRRLSNSYRSLSSKYIPRF